MYTQIAACTYIRTYMPITTPQDFFHTMEFSEKVERELDTLQQSAVAYVGAGAREEGEVMGVVSSLRTNSREICEQVRTLSVLIAPYNVVTLHHTPHRPKSHHHTHLPHSPQARELESSLKASLAQWSTLLDHASLFQQWLERAECEVDREYAGSTLEEAQAFCNIVMVCVGVCEGQLNV